MVFNLFGPLIRGAVQGVTKSVTKTKQNNPKHGKKATKKKKAYNDLIKSRGYRR